MRKRGFLGKSRHDPPWYGHAKSIALFILCFSRPLPPCLAHPSLGLPPSFYSLLGSQRPYVDPPSPPPQRELQARTSLPRFHWTELRNRRRMLLVNSLHLCACVQEAKSYARRATRRHFGSTSSRLRSLSACGFYIGLTPSSACLQYTEHNSWSTWHPES